MIELTSKNNENKHIFVIFMIFMIEVTKNAYQGATKLKDMFDDVQ